MKTYFVVREYAGPAWQRGVPMRSQPLWFEHAAFMDALEAERFVILGGPIDKGEEHEALLIIDAPDEAAARGRFAQDPWIRGQILLIRGIETWTILLDSRESKTA